MPPAVKTIADIAVLAGVSKSTVSRALNDSPLISQETKDRIRAIAQEHHFETHQGARCLSLQRSHTLALVIPGLPHVDHFITDPFLVELLRGIMRKIADYRYDLLIGQPPKHDPREVQRYLDSKRADGLILLGCRRYLEAISDLFAPQLPIIVWGAIPDASFCSVDSDNLNGGRIAVQHLLHCGRKRIAFIGGTSDEPEVILRYQGYAKALQEAGYTPDPDLVVYGDYTSRSGYETMQQLLRQASDVEGVFVCSDVMAIGAMEAIRESGRQAPRDISVVGFDDIPLATYCSPPLTTIHQHLTKAGQTLVQNLMQFLKDQIVSRTILPVELVVRKSSVPQP